MSIKDLLNETEEMEDMIIKRHGTSALNKKQAAKELNIGVTKLDELRNSGEIRYNIVGKSVRIPARVIAEMIA